MRVVKALASLVVLAALMVQPTASLERDLELTVEVPEPRVWVEDRELHLSFHPVAEAHRYGVAVLVPNGWDVSEVLAEPIEVEPLGEGVVCSTGELLEYGGTHSFRGYRIALISIGAVRYQGLRAELVRKVRLVLKLKPASYVYPYEFPLVERWIERNVVNPWELESYRPVHMSVDYLIITREMFLQALQSFVNWKKSLGFKVKVATLEEIVRTQGGRDSAEKIRNYIRQLYGREAVKWVLLVGDADPDDVHREPKYLVDKPWEIPVRYAYNPDGVERFGIIEPPVSYTPTDMYYACLDGTWDKDRDGVYGESRRNSTENEVDWFPEVYVGRLCVRTVEELRDMLAKAVSYEKNAPKELTMLLIGCQTHEHEDTSRIAEYIAKFAPPDVRVIRIYERFGNLSHSNVVKTINKYDPQLISIGAHGNEYELGTRMRGGETILSIRDTLTLRGRGFIAFVYACASNAFDMLGIPYYFGEMLMKDPDGSAVAYIGATRTIWTGREWQQYEFWKEMFQEGNYFPGSALYNAKISMLVAGGSYDDEATRKNVFAMCLLGDPALMIRAGANPVSYLSLRLRAALEKAKITAETDADREIAKLIASSGKSLVDKILVGGPFSNRLAREHNPSWLQFKREDSSIVMVVKNRRFEFTPDMWSSRDYGIALVLRHKRGYLIMLEGITRYGTRAATLYLLNNIDVFLNTKAVVVEWVDVNGDHMVDANEVKEVWSIAIEG
ncbi:MAG: hypothetical protein DRN96_03395 [Thermoproteota archaeon]|nr:MAG: hypothetical protein DRN96_03395 [Candidatus Korarchaeota archaeon]